MKKKICFLFAVFLAASSFAWTPRFSVGLGSGFDFYGDSLANNRKSDFDFENAMNLYVEVNMLFPLSEKCLLSAGVDDFFAFTWDGDERFNIWDLHFNLGFYFYPGLAGLLVGANYTWGKRLGLIDLSGQEKQYPESFWGNGFKISVEYDFLYKRRGPSPVLGTAWRFIPRGENIFDNFLLFYVKLLYK